MELHVDASNLPPSVVSCGGYINLIKSSWVLIDIIARHPQLNFLIPDVQYEVKLLATASIPQFPLIPALWYFLTLFIDDREGVQEDRSIGTQDTRPPKPQRRPVEDLGNRTQAINFTAWRRSR